MPYSCMLRKIATKGMVVAVLLATSCVEEPNNPDYWSKSSHDAGTDSLQDSGSNANHDVNSEADGSQDFDAQHDSPVDSADSSTLPDDSAVTEPDATIHVPCTKVAHLGDSLTAYTIDELKDAYAAVGIEATFEAYGGRAIYEYCCGDDTTGKQAAERLVASGFAGCWVIALGTNDTANVSAGAAISRADRIDAMMKTIDDSAQVRVMWVNTYTTKTEGHWSNANMELWNAELEKARARWPNMHVFDWASIAKTGSAPFSDGIHHTTQGYAVRNAAIAKAASEL